MIVIASVPHPAPAFARLATLNHPNIAAMYGIAKAGVGDSYGSGGFHSSTMTC
jgi:hypothetical protein